MAKITIKKRKEDANIVVNDTNYEMKVDGNNITDLIKRVKSISLDLDANELPILKIEAHITDLDIEVDAEVEKELKIPTYKDGGVVPEPKTVRSEH